MGAPPWQADGRYERVACDGERPRATAYVRCSRSTETGLHKLLAHPEVRGLDVDQWHGHSSHLLAADRLYFAERYRGAARLQDLRIGVSPVKDAAQVARLEALTHFHLRACAHDL